MGAKICWLERSIHDPLVCWFKETLNLATVVRFSVDKSGDRHRLRVLRNKDK
ncbi:hypothetical protein J3E69DRAFT_337353 [Trichoderma sp. SZMC 28015]